jgi:hypothetical protein
VTPTLPNIVDIPYDILLAILWTTVSCTKPLTSDIQELQHHSLGSGRSAEDEEKIWASVILLTGFARILAIIAVALNTIKAGLRLRVIIMSRPFSCRNCSMDPKSEFGLGSASKAGPDALSPVLAFFPAGDYNDFLDKNSTSL